jgi:adenosylhomocysteinase
MLPPLVPFVEAVGRVVDIRCAIGIPYSTLPGVYREVAARVPTLLPDELGELAAVAGDQTIAALRERALPVVLCEVGGYCASTLNGIAAAGDRFLGVVEHTMQGHWRYAEHPALPCPVFSIAASRLKALENDQVGRSLAYTLEHSLRHHFHRKLSDVRVCVLGYGGVGAPAARFLTDLGARVMVFDTCPIRRAKARLDAFETPARADALRRADVVLGVSGSRSLDAGDVALLKDGVVLASGSSKQVELDVAGLLRQSVVVGDEAGLQTLATGGKLVHLLRDGMPINFHAENVLGPVVDLVYTELYMCIRAVARGRSPAGLHELPLADQRAIADVWCGVYL